MRKGVKKIKKEELKDSESLLKRLNDLEQENARLKSLISEQANSQIIPPPSPLGFAKSDFYEAFFEQIPFLMWSKDIKGKYTAVNSEFADKLGLKIDDIIGKNDYDIYPEKFAKRYSDTDEIVIESRDKYIYEIQIPIKNGIRWFEVIKVPLFSDGREASGIAGFARDIGARKQYEGALTESEEKFRELAESISDSFILRSGDEILYVNPAFEEVFGYTRKELYSNPDLYRKWIHPGDADRIKKVLNSDKYKNTHYFDEQFRIIKKNGETRWIWNRSYPVSHGGKDISSRVVSVATDITKIKELEENLLTYRFEQQAILDNIPHLAWLKDRKFKYVSANQAFYNYFEITPEELVGKSDFDLVAENLANDYLTKDKEVIEAGKSKLFYEVEKGRFGERYSETYKTPVIAENGKVIGIAGISRDITDQKLAEKALIKSEEKYKDLVTLLPEVIFETDNQNRITFVNLKGYELTGYGLSDLIKGMDLISLIAPDDRERARDVLSEIKKGKELRGIDFNLLTKDGKEIPVVLYTNNMFQDSKWVGIRGVMVDNTNRLDAEEKEKVYQSKLEYLSDSAVDFLSMPLEENLFDFIGIRLKELLNDTDVLINSFDEKRKQFNLVYTSLNLDVLSQMQSLLETSPSDFQFSLSPENESRMKKHADNLVEINGGFHESTFGLIPEEVSKTLTELLGIKKFYGISMVRFDSIYGNILFLARKDEIPEKNFIEAFIYQASIALHKRRLERDLIKAKSLAEESDRLKTAFLANMSHEIRTPMNGILGLTQLMTNHPVTEDQKKEYLAMINANGKMLLDLVNDIIDISKIESKQVDLFETEFSLNQMMEDLRRFISAEKMVKNMDEVELIYKPYFKDKKSVIFSDQAKIKQVLTNLIGNAVKFTKKGSIEFGYKPQKDNMLLFFVKDTGIGILESKLKVIFDRFTQADQSLTRPYGGSGLGLAISKGFVQRMGGTIWAESEEGKGSSFYFTIPYKPVSAMKAREMATPKKITFDWSDLTILVVEDNIISYKLLEISLNKTGCNILHADNGQKAIDIVSEHDEIDLVLMDIQLPVKNGYTATREIKELKPALPVIAQTANAMDDDRQKCMDAGCSDYITKPIILDKLLPVIETFIKKS
jgi:PAS domain S-box-containing protein